MALTFLEWPPVCIPVTGPLERPGQQCGLRRRRSLGSVSLGHQGCSSRPDPQEVSRSCQGFGILQPSFIQGRAKWNILEESEERVRLIWALICTEWEGKEATRSPSLITHGLRHRTRVIKMQSRSVPYPLSTPPPF